MFTTLEMILLLVVGLSAIGAFSYFLTAVKKPKNTVFKKIGSDNFRPILKNVEQAQTTLNPISFMLLGFLAAGLVFYFLDRTNPPAPFPTPGLSLKHVFEMNNNKSEAKFHARVFGTICSSVADVIEYDAKLKTPRIETGVDIDNLRRMTREYRMRGASLSQKYPELSPQLDNYFKTILGSTGGGGKLTPDIRAKWITAFRGVALAAESVYK